MSLKVTLHVGAFIHPPAECMASTLKYMLDNNLADCDTQVILGEKKKEMEIADLHAFVRHITDRAEHAMNQRAENSLSASIVQMRLRVTDAKNRIVHQRMVFIAARNEKGHEWIYGHFVGEIQVPIQVTECIANAVDTVLEERNTCNLDPAEDELECVTGFISLLTEGVTKALEQSTISRTLNS